MIPSHQGVSGCLSQVQDLAVEVLASKFNNKLDRFDTRSRDPQTFTVGALLTLG